MEMHGVDFQKVTGVKSWHEGLKATILKRSKIKFGMNCEYNGHNIWQWKKLNKQSFRRDFSWKLGKTFLPDIQSHAVEVEIKT